MGIFSRRKTQTRSRRGIAVAQWNGSDCTVPGYTTLSNCPEVQTACRQIASTIASMTIHLMSNTQKGDQRLINELSRMIDITPSLYMTRKAWMEAIIMNLLLYGDGNSVVIPHTKDGVFTDFEIVAPSRVKFVALDNGGYRIRIDNKYDLNPDDVLHFINNSDQKYAWMGKGYRVLLQDVAHNLKQARETEKGFLASKWKPSIIVKVDALTDEFSNPKGRKKLLESYFESTQAGEPWMIPAEQFSVEQIRPLSLADLAISDVVTMNRELVASIIGVPNFVLGVGNYDTKAWNGFIQHTVMPIAKNVEQEMTRKLIRSPKMYLKFNINSLMDYDIQTLANVYGSLSDKGIVDGNEVRDKLGLSPRDGLDELRILENYIPADKIGDQKKLVQGE